MSYYEVTGTMQIRLVTSRVEHKLNNYLFCLFLMIHKTMKTISSSPFKQLHWHGQTIIVYKRKNSVDDFNKFLLYFAARCQFIFFIIITFLTNNSIKISTKKLLYYSGKTLIFFSSAIKLFWVLLWFWEIGL